MNFPAKKPAVQHASTRHDHAHGGLHQDLEVLLRAMPDRRRLLRMMSLGAIAPAALMACNDGTSTTSTTSSSGGSCSIIPTETAGPYPGDGTNGPNALTLSGIVRNNITSSLTSSSVAAGVPLTINLKLVNSGCSSLAGYAVYLWHCTAEGQYSLYGNIPDDSSLRGVQVADANGNVSFTTIFPGCYDGRYPHVHFEVYPSLAVATSGNNDVKTSQFTFTSSAFADVYADSNYSNSASNLSKVSLSSDGIFSDGSSLQIATTTGSASAGYTASLQVAAV